MEVERATRADLAPGTAFLLAAFDCASLRAGVAGPGLAVAVRRRHHPVGCEVAVPAAGELPRRRAGARRIPVLDPQCLCRLAADLRSAIADLLAAASGVGGDRSA